MVKIALVLFAVLFAGVATAGNLPDTGQTKCYNDSVEIPCPSEGEAFYGQDGNYAKKRSYTVLAEGRIVRDNATGLMWEVKTDDGSIHDRDDTYTWYDPNPDTNGGFEGYETENDTKDFIDALNDADFGGYSDWRLPTVKELASIVNMGTYNPSIDEAYFPNTQSSWYWSSTTIARDIGDAWSVYFGYGADYGYGKGGSLYVRAVRGGQW